MTRRFRNLEAIVWAENAKGFYHSNGQAAILEYEAQFYEI